MDTLYIEKKDWDSFIKGMSAEKKVFAPVSADESLEASEFEKFRCGLGGCRCDEQRAPFGTPAETVRRVTDERSEEKQGKQSGFPSGMTGSNSDRQRGVNPYESNPDRDYLVYKKICPGDEINIIYNRARPVEPLKLFLLPFKERVVPSVEDIPEIVVMGPAACDIKGMEILNKVFKDSDYKDPNYPKRREKTLIISFECITPYTTCFCELVGTHPYPELGFDLNIAQFDEGFLVDVGSEKGADFIGNDQKFFQATSEQIKKRDTVRQRVVERIKEVNRDFDFMNIEEIKGMYQTELWKTHKDITNCVQCGSCTNNCPTCVCFLLEDTGEKGISRKTKVWDSCLFPGYARMAAGASPRPTLYDRYANRLLCKYWYMVENFQIRGCTGCGRCIAGCVGKIDKRKIVTEVLREKSKV